MRLRYSAAEVRSAMPVDPRTSANTMLIPGYVSQFTVTFDTPGEYLIVCNEYCGQGHHTMSGKLIVEEARK